jgi:pimeloyl-ACP methyl ester carboxylesterase
MMRPRFAQVGGRNVCWRAGGAGPATLLIHGSPQSSRALAGLGAAVAAAGLCAIMPDTPGAGHSDKLPAGDLTIADLADALAGFADAVDLGRFALYGTHTGAAIACAFAARHPDRVTTLVLDGLAAWTDSERAAYREDYAPPFIPSWDGAHLTWLWSRMEAQSLFFPWHQQTAKTWRGVDLSPPWHLHRNAMDMLDSGDAYRPIYQASLAFDPAEFLPVAPPTQMLMLESDVLRGHAARPALAHLPAQYFDQPPDLWRAVAVALAQNPGDPAPSFSNPTMFWRGTLSGHGKPLVLLHPAGASSRVFESLLAKTAATSPVLAFDLPGHGFDESEMPTSAQDIAAVVKTQCRALGLDHFTVAGTRFGALIAAAMANTQIRATTISPPSTAPDLATRGAIALTPEWDGSHLLRAWRVAWRQAIFDPWYDTTAAQTPPPDLNPATIHAAAIDLLRAGPAWQTANHIEANGGAIGPAA